MCDRRTSNTRVHGKVIYDGGRTKIKITLDGSVVYYFDIWVGDQVGQESILGMDLMVPEGVRLD